ncbi:MAG: right-handed parallel beta-helix repeat-containing protein [Phycisphaerales bacterium]|nr:right-handed parallel beta-helix repeat-containing protein [Phycisphaerales bacterium]
MAVGQAWAENRQVPEKYDTIQVAIDASSNGDIISVAPGQYFESINLKGKSIVLKSRGPEPAVLEGEGVTGSLINCTSGEGAYTRIEGLVIRRGSGDVERYGERSRVGGGMLLLNASPTLINCQFVLNRVSYNGGGVYASNSNSQFRNCTFASNSAEKGGGVFANRSTLSFMECEFSQNNANFGGGGIFSDNRSTTTVKNCRFTDNRASFNGGGLYDYDSATTVSDSVFLNNIGAYKGGAAYHGWRSRGRIGSGNEFLTPNDDVAGSGRMINQADPLGACFIGDRCVLATQSDCREGTGNWAGPDTRCDEEEPPEEDSRRASGDLNEDGRVDVRDMAILLGSWGSRR